MTGSGIPHLNATSPEDLPSSLAVFRKPETPDPFVNAPLVSLGKDEEGRERFWISCINNLTGTTSFLIQETGEHRVYRWPGGDPIRAIYAVAQEDEDTLWLTGGSTQVLIRLELSTGGYDTFPREAGRFVTSGMAYDPQTGKLFCGGQTALISFDTRSRKPARIYGPGDKPLDNFQHDFWQNSDGTYGTLMINPGLSYLRWDPQEESLWWRRITEDEEEGSARRYHRLKYRDGDRVYLADLGWLDGLSGDIVPHEHPPSREACWFGRDETHVYGADFDSLTFSSKFIRWDPSTGETEEIFSNADTAPMNCALSKAGKILTVNLYGELRRFDGQTGLLELTRRLQSSNPHRCNVIIPIDDARVTGTPFISQNFWVYDTRKGDGTYGGRAAGRGGQVDYAVRVGGKIYFAAYTGGQLSEYDSDEPAGFPRNPRLVAQIDQGNHGAGITTDGSIVWAAFRPAYGTLDGAMVRYETETGLTSYRVGAQKNQHIVDPIYDVFTSCIIAGTSRISDCETAEPEDNCAFAVIVDPVTMDVIERVPASDGSDTLRNIGPLSVSQWLMSDGENWLVFDTDELTLSGFEGIRPAADSIQHAGEAGLFLIQFDDRLFLWDAKGGELEERLALERGFVVRWWVHEDDITFDCGEHAAVWRDWRSR